MNDSEKMHRASLANQLIENEAFIEAVNGLAKSYIAAWKDAKTVDEREDCHRYVMLCNKFAADLKGMIIEGGMATQRVKELEGKSKWSL